MSELVKVRLLNDGDYSEGFPAGYEFPVVAIAEIDNGFAYVSSAELYNIGAIQGMFADEDDPVWPFIVGTECEIIND